MHQETVKEFRPTSSSAKAEGSRVDYTIGFPESVQRELIEKLREVDVPVLASPIAHG